MNVSALEEYGLRCAARLATLRAHETLSAPEIAELEGLSVEYVSKFMLHLKRAGLVRTVRGMKGGFALERPPYEISLKEVFDALSNKRRFSESFCQSFAGKSETCVRHNGCAIRPFWQVMSHYVEAFTQEMTLQDLLKTETETRHKTESIARKNIEQLRAERSQTIHFEKSKLNLPESESSS